MKKTRAICLTLILFLSAQMALSDAANTVTAQALTSTPQLGNSIIVKTDYSVSHQPSTYYYENANDPSLVYHSVSPLSGSAAYYFTGFPPQWTFVNITQGGVLSFPESDPRRLDGTPATFDNDPAESTNNWSEYSLQRLSIDGAIRKEGFVSVTSMGHLTTKQVTDVSPIYDPPGTWNLTPYNLLELWIRTDNVNTLHNVKITLHSYGWDDSRGWNNYYSWDVRTGWTPDVWRRIVLRLDSPDSITGKPDLKAIDFLTISLLYMEKVTARIWVDDIIVDMVPNLNSHIYKARVRSDEAVTVWFRSNELYHPVGFKDDSFAAGWTADEGVEAASDGNILLLRGTTESSGYRYSGLSIDASKFRYILLRGEADSPASINFSFLVGSKWNVRTWNLAPENKEAVFDVWKDVPDGNITSIMFSGQSTPTYSIDDVIFAEAVPVAPLTPTKVEGVISQTSRVLEGSIISEPSYNGFIAQRFTSDQLFNVPDADYVGIALYGTWNGTTKDHWEYRWVKGAQIHVTTTDHFYASNLMKATNNLEIKDIEVYTPKQTLLFVDGDFAEGWTGINYATLTAEGGTLTIAPGEDGWVNVYRQTPTYTPNEDTIVELRIAEVQNATLGFTMTVDGSLQPLTDINGETRHTKPGNYTYHLPGGHRYETPSFTVQDITQDVKGIVKIDAITISTTKSYDKIDVTDFSGTMYALDGLNNPPSMRSNTVKLFEGVKWRNGRFVNNYPAATSQNVGSVDATSDGDIYTLSVSPEDQEAKLAYAIRLPVSDDAPVVDRSFLIVRYQSTNASAWFGVRYVDGTVDELTQQEAADFEVGVIPLKPEKLDSVMLGVLQSNSTGMQTVKFDFAMISTTNSILRNPGDGDSASAEVTPDGGGFFTGSLFYDYTNTAYILQSVDDSLPSTANNGREGPSKTYRVHKTVGIVTEGQSTADDEKPMLTYLNGSAYKYRARVVSETSITGDGLDAQSLSVRGAASAILGLRSPDNVLRATNSTDVNGFTTFILDQSNLTQSGVYEISIMRDPNSSASYINQNQSLNIWEIRFTGKDEEGIGPVPNLTEIGIQAEWGGVIKSRDAVFRVPEDNYTLATVIWRGIDVAPPSESRYIGQDTDWSENLIIHRIDLGADGIIRLGLNCTTCTGIRYIDTERKLSFSMASNDAMVGRLEAGKNGKPDAVYIDQEGSEKTIEWTFSRDGVVAFVLPPSTEPRTIIFKWPSPQSTPIEPQEAIGEQPPAQGLMAPTSLSKSAVMLAATISLLGVFGIVVTIAFRGYIKRKLDEVDSG